MLHCYLARTIYVQHQFNNITFIQANIMLLICINGVWGNRFSLFFFLISSKLYKLSVKHVSSRPLLALSRDGRFGRLGKSSLEVPKQESVRCVFYCAFFSLLFDFLEILSTIYWTKHQFVFAIHAKQGNIWIGVVA